MRYCSCRGTSLVELLVALVLVGIAAGASLGASLAAIRLDRATRLRSTIDLARHDSVAVAAAAPACRGAVAPGTLRVALPAGPGREPLAVVHRCGR